MSDLLTTFLADNCKGSWEYDRLKQEMIKSDEWMKFVDEVAKTHSAAAKDSSNIKESLGLAPAQPSPATVANRAGRERGAATKKSRKGDPTLLDRKDTVNFLIAEQYLGITERQRQHLVKSGVLIVKGQGNNRKITTESLRKYLPPENPK